MIAHTVESLLFIWEIQIECLAPGLSLAQPRQLQVQAFGEWTSKWRSLCFFLMCVCARAHAPFKTNNLTIKNCFFKRRWMVQHWKGEFSPFLYSVGCGISVDYWWGGGLLPQFTDQMQVSSTTSFQIHPEIVYQLNQHKWMLIFPWSSPVTGFDLDSLS